MFAVAEQPYEDERLDRQKEWPERKKETPYGKIPTLYVDDKPLSQSVTICRYLGKKFGLFVDDEWLSAVGDEVADAVHDFLPPAAKFVYMKLAGNVEEANKLLQEFAENFLFPTLKVLEAKLKENKWFCGEKMTWVDIFVACYVSQLNAHSEESFVSFPLVKSHFERVVALPQIQKWLKQRPQTTH
ncbi:putative glutathione S-transferase 9 [Armadillidium vulgare]|nr:putative glutathione S-transferase 9 [Armadillidium vulgare]